MNVRLVPPSLAVLGRIIHSRIPLTQHYASMADWMADSWSLDSCEANGYPRIRFRAQGIGQGLAIGWTETDAGILLWVGEVSCHPLCLLTGERECSQGWDINARMEAMKNKHEKYLTMLSHRGSINSRAISPKKESAK